MPTRFIYFSLAICSLALFFAPMGRAQQAPKPASAGTAPAPATTATAPAAPATDPSTMAMAKAIGLMNKNDVDGALVQLSESIKLNAKNPAAYVLRASAYCQKKQWDLAEQDFKSASDLDPHNVALKFNLVAVKFMQKKFDEARPGYVALEKDMEMGDFATYNVFLCDLAGGHEDLATKELAVFNKAGYNPSYYFGNAAWEIAHKNYDKGKSWLEIATHIYAPRKNAYYTESLIYLGYWPLPNQDAAPAAPAPPAK